MINCPKTVFLPNLKFTTKHKLNLNLKDDNILEHSNKQSINSDRTSA